MVLSLPFVFVTNERLPSTNGIMWLLLYSGLGLTLSSCLIVVRLKLSTRKRFASTDGGIVAMAMADSG